MSFARVPGVRSKALRRACEIVGGEAQLRGYLRVSALSLTLWMAGAEPPPTDVFLKAVDVIMDRELDELRRSHHK
jgi:hypothetical protein